MKKIVFLLVAAIAAGAVSAQKPFTFGPKVGINVTDLHPDGLDDINHLSGTKPALVIGAFAEYRALKWLAVSADVLYSRQGSTDKATWTERGPGGGFVTESEEFSYRLNYLNIPILANFYVTNGLALKAGIQPGFLLSGKYRAKVDGGSWNTEDTKHYFKSTDFSIPVGISYTFEQGLVIDARYNIPVTDIATDEFKEDFSGGNEELNKMTNRVFSLTVGWKF